MHDFQVRLDGEWVEDSDDGTTRSVGTRRFQGIGKTTREGRMNAAEAALNRLRDLMPGLNVPPGVVPEEWRRYVTEGVLDRRFMDRQPFTIAHMDNLTNGGGDNDTLY